jgi:AmmeMemoRadiSam system protein A
MTISAEDRARLMSLARAAVEAAVTRAPKPVVEDASGILGEMRGCFVTLTNAGRLRGCIGTFTPQLPLGEQIVEMGIAAAVEDPRFWSDRITPAELENVTIEVSVLSPLTATAEPEKLEIGTHGIYIVQGGRSGCFLPEVATDQGWDAEQFLTYCCASKAGLPGDAWKQPETTVSLFTSEKFED